MITIRCISILNQGYNHHVMHLYHSYYWGWQPLLDKQTRTLKCKLVVMYFPTSLHHCHHLGIRNPNQCIVTYQAHGRLGIHSFKTCLSVAIQQRTQDHTSPTLRIGQLCCDQTILQSYYLLLFIGIWSTWWIVARIYLFGPTRYVFTC